MTENRTVELANGTEIYEQHFDWDSKQQGIVLSSFFYGYILTQVGNFLRGDNFLTNDNLTFLNFSLSEDTLHQELEEMS